MSAKLVLDTSVTMTWWFLEERTPATTAVLDDLEYVGAVVPSLWFLEVCNSLAMAAQKKRKASSTPGQFLQMLGTLDIEVDEAPGLDSISDLLALCKKHGLTSYDASYLALAMKRHLPLATLDAKLAKAAKAEGLKVLG